MDLARCARADWRAYRGWVLLGLLVSTVLGAAAGFRAPRLRYTWGDLFLGVASGRVSEVRVSAPEGVAGIEFSRVVAVDGGRERRLLATGGQREVLLGVLDRFGISPGVEEAVGLSVTELLRAEGSAPEAAVAAVGFAVVWIGFLAVRACLRRGDVPGFVALAWAFGTGMVAQLGLLAPLMGLAAAGFLFQPFAIVSALAHAAAFLRLRRMAWRIKRLLAAAAVVAMAAGSAALATAPGEIEPAEFIHALYTGRVARWEATFDNVVSPTEEVRCDVVGEYAGGARFFTTLEGPQVGMLAGVHAVVGPSRVVVVPLGEALVVLFPAAVAAVVVVAGIFYAWSRSCRSLGFAILGHRMLASAALLVVLGLSVDLHAHMSPLSPPPTLAGTLALVVAAAALGLAGVAGLYVLGVEVTAGYACRPGGELVRREDLEGYVGRDA